MSRYVPLFAIVVVFGGLGTALLLTSHAATPAASFEAESGTVSAAATNVTDTTASGGHAVKFGSGSTGGGTVTHGSQINTSNTGYLAYVGPQGQHCTDATLTVYNSKVNASALGANPYCVWLKQGMTVDTDITLTASRIDNEVYTNGHHVTLNYVTANATTPQDYAIGPGNFDVTRSQLTGSSDGVRFENTNLVEDYIRVALQSAQDHNDGIQAYMAGSGGSVIRCNIDARPVNAAQIDPSILGNAAVFFADNSHGTVELRDNYLAGGGYTMRLNESMFYRVTGNIVEKNSWIFGPLTTTNAVSGAFLEWSNNKLSDGTTLNP